MLICWWMTHCSQLAHTHKCQCLSACPGAATQIMEGMQHDKLTVDLGRVTHPTEAEHVTVRSLCAGALAQIEQGAQAGWKVLRKLILSNGLVRPFAGQPSSIQVGSMCRGVCVCAGGRGGHMSVCGSGCVCLGRNAKSWGRRSVGSS